MARAYIGIDRGGIDYNSLTSRLQQIAGVDEITRTYGAVDLWVTVNAPDDSALNNAIDNVTGVPVDILLETGKLAESFVLRVHPDRYWPRELQLGSLTAYMGVTLDRNHPKGTVEDVVSQLMPIKQIGDIAAIDEGTYSAVVASLGRGRGFSHDIMTIISGTKDEVEHAVFEQVQNMEGVMQTREYIWINRWRRESR